MARNAEIPAEPPEQRSEVHRTTGNADVDPNGPADVDATRDRTGHGHVPWDGEPVVPEVPAGTLVVEDLTDAGGPLVIKSADPDLNPPRVPIDPFPTDGKPEIDPPVAR